MRRVSLIDKARLESLREAVQDREQRVLGLHGVTASQESVINKIVQDVRDIYNVLDQILEELTLD